MKTLEKNTKKSLRFEMRLTEEEKAMFERATYLSGHNTIANFIRFVIKRESEEIIRENEKFLVSERGRKIFFDALTNPPEPNEALKSAGKRYKDLLDE